MRNETSASMRGSSSRVLLSASTQSSAPPRCRTLSPLSSPVHTAPCLRTPSSECETAPVSTAGRAHRVGVTHKGLGERGGKRGGDMSTGGSKQCHGLSPEVRRVYGLCPVWHAHLPGDVPLSASTQSSIPPRCMTLSPLSSLVHTAPCVRAPPTSVRPHRLRPAGRTVSVCHTRG